MKKNNILVGAHISIAGGVDKSIQRALDIGCTTMQIFTKSNRMWAARTLATDEISAFKAGVKEHNVQGVTVHASYLINIAAQNPETEKKSIDALAIELDRCQQLDIPYLVLHPGSHTGAGVEAGIKKIAKNLDIVFEKTPGNTMITLECMAGQGTNVGYTFEQLRDIIKLSTHKKRLGVCLDVCHIFSAGYDISTQEKYNDVMNEFDTIIGLKKLKVIHMNNSKTELGSKKDRHECLSTGIIPLKVFGYIMNDERLKDVPKILETPDESLYATEIKLLKNMCK